MEPVEKKSKHPIGGDAVKPSHALAYTNLKSIQLDN